MITKSTLSGRARYLVIAALVGSSGLVKAQTTANFDNLTLQANNKWDGSGPTVKSNFTEGNAVLANTYETAYGGYWSQGWAYGSQKDSVTAGSSNLYAARPASGANASDKYVIGKDGSILNLKGTSLNDTVNGIFITNGTYAALSMKTGDMFAKKFGGATGNDPDYFKVVVRGYSNGALKLDSVECFLADFRSANNANDYILSTWKHFSLKGLGKVDSLKFILRSSDVGAFGMNTPGFFCIDDLQLRSGTVTFENLAVPFNGYWKGQEGPISSAFTNGNARFQNQYTISGYGDYWNKGWAYSNKTDNTTAGYTNLYSAITGKDKSGNGIYAVGQQDAGIKLLGKAAGEPLKGFYVTNTTYAGLSMKNGDMFAKKFGGANGTDPDFFTLTVYGYLNGTKKTDTVVFYLADFRDANNANDYIVQDWRFVDLMKLGKVDSIRFKITTSDVGAFGPNTPLFFAIDEFTTSDGVFVSLNEFTRSEALEVYPNPASDKIRVKNATIGEEVQIFDFSGRLVSKQTLSTEHSLSLSILKSGIYTLYLAKSGAHAKFVKE